jgi:hypothetical protein
MFCFVLDCHASSASDEINRQEELIQDEILIAQNQAKELNNIKRVLKYIDLSQAEILFELEKWMQLSFIRFQIESESGTSVFAN